MDVKMNLRIITKNLAAESKIGSPLKLILEPIRLTSPTRQPGSYRSHFLSVSRSFLGSNK